MPQKIIEKDGVKKLHISVQVRCKDDPTGRIQLKRVYENVELGSTKANTLERELLREAEREKAQKEVNGTCWQKLLTLYEAYAFEELEKGRWCQSKQTYEESIQSLHNWTSDWYKESAARISASDVTKVFHKMKEQELSDVTIVKLKSAIKKVFEFGLLFDHVKGIKHCPTTGVTIKSRRRMRTEILQKDEIKKLLFYAKQYEPAWFYIWAFAVYSGCRNGELYALKWSDINFEDRLMLIQRSYNKKYRVEKGTKTEDWRYVPICPPLWELIQELKQIHDHDVQRGTCKYPGYILPRPGLWQNGEQARKLRLFCQEIGITPVCFHTLRACFATELLKQGVDVPSVMRVGGWKSLKTMMHYVRLSGMDARGVTNSLDYRSESPIETGRALMNAVGEAFKIEQHDPKIIPLKSRTHPWMSMVRK